MPYFRPLFVMGKPSLVPMGYARVLLLPGPGWGLVGAPGGKKHMGIVHEAHAHLEEHRRREAEQPLQGSRGDKKGKGGRRKMGRSVLGVASNGNIHKRYRECGRRITRREQGEGE